jgi:quinol monooxygenase YgiN
MSAHQRVVVAIAVAKSGQASTLSARLGDVARASWAEPGVVTYAVHDVLDQPGTFMMVEVYSSDQAFDDHLATDHVRALIADLPDLIEGELLVHHGRAAASLSGIKGAL